MKMKYIGNGSFVAGVPARDLSAAEVEKHGRAKLLSTGLYILEGKITVKANLKLVKRRKPNLSTELLVDELDEENNNG